MATPMISADFLTHATGLSRPPSLGRTFLIFPVEGGQEVWLARDALLRTQDAP